MSFLLGRPIFRGYVSFRELDELVFSMFPSHWPFCWINLDWYTGQVIIYILYISNWPWFHCVVFMVMTRNLSQAIRHYRLLVWTWFYMFVLTIQVSFWNSRFFLFNVFLFLSPLLVNLNHTFYVNGSWCRRWMVELHHIQVWFGGSKMIWRNLH